MNFAEDLEMPEESRKRVNEALKKQRDKLALRDKQIEQAFKAGFSIGFGTTSAQFKEYHWLKFKTEVLEVEE